MYNYVCEWTQYTQKERMDIFQNIEQFHSGFGTRIKIEPGVQSVKLVW